MEIDSLLSGYRWGAGGQPGQGISLTYSFGSIAASVYRTGYATPDPQVAWNLSASAQTAIRQAVGAWSSVANIACSEVSDTGAACGDLRFSGSNAPQTAYTFLPAANLPEAGDVWFGDSFADSSLSWAPGSYEYLTALHEIGHALGLKHPHESEGGFPAAPLAIDNQLFSVMSYRSTPGAPVDQGYWQNRFATTPMVEDIRAIQYLYGANMATNAGNTVYSWKPGQAIYETIWDGGGYDTISWENQTSGAQIDLRPGSYSHLGPGWSAGIFLEPRTLGIAYNCWIEAAAGGFGNDMIIGNDLDNALAGGAGNDTLFGGNGKDLLEGGDGNDTMAGEAGNDTLVGGAGNDVLLGGEDGDILWGGDGNDTMTGEAGNDTLVGGAGDDVLFESTGDDVLFGGDGNDALSGDAGDDALSGDAGDDTLFGGDGNDTLFGGDGGDVLFGGGDVDVLVGDGGNDALFGGAGNDMLLGGDGNDAIFLDGGVDVAWGGAGADLFLFGAVSAGSAIADFTPGIDRLSLFDPTLDRAKVIASAHVVNGSTVFDLAPGSSVVILGQTGSTANWFL